VAKAALLASASFALVDVLSSSLVVKDFALLITHGMGIYGDPDLAPSRRKIRFSNPLTKTLRFDQILEFLSAGRVDIHFMGNVLESADQIFGKIKSMHAREGRIGFNVLPFRCTLKDTLARVFKNDAVLLSALRSAFSARFCSVMSRPMQAARSTPLAPSMGKKERNKSLSPTLGYDS